MQFSEKAKLVVSNTAGSGFLVGNILLLKLLRTFSLSLTGNPALFKKTFFQLVFYLKAYPLIY